MLRPPRPAATGLAWDGNRLNITSDDVMARVDRPYLSVSTSQAMAGCPARFVAEKSMPEGVDLFSPSSLGTAAHTIGERLYQLGPTRRDRRTATSIMLGLARELTETYPEVMSDPVTYHRWCEEVSHRYGGIFEMEDPAEVQTLYTERKFDGVEVAGVPAMGFIDRQEEIEARNKVGSRVVDYKFGKAKKAGAYGRDDHGDQLRIYAEAVRIKDGVLPLEAKVLYVTHRQAVRVPLGPKYMKPTLAKFSQAWTDLRTYVDQASFPTRTSPLCGWCPLVNACPVARAEGKVDRVGNAPTEVDLGIPTLRPMTSTSIATGATGGGYGSTSAPEYAPDPYDEPPADLYDEVPPDPQDFAVAPEVIAAAAAFAPTSPGAGDIAPDPTHDMGESDAGRTAQPDDDHDEGETMSTQPWREAKPWEGSVVDGHLSLNSYAATAVFGTTELAVEALHDAGQPVSPATVGALASLFARVISEAQSTVTDGDRDWQSGANTRMRGALRTVIATVPIPFGASSDDWNQWSTVATRRCVSIATVALNLFNNGPSADDVMVLAEKTTPVATPATVRRIA